MIYAIISNGVVANRIELDPTLEADFAEASGLDLVADADNVSQIGGSWNGTAFSDPPAPTPAIPQSVTPRQIRLALNQMGLRSSVDTYVHSQSQDVQDTWEYATQILRDNELIAAAATALGKTDADIDALFTLAASL